MKRLVSKIKNWWEGKYIPPRPYDPYSPIIIIETGHYERPFIAKLASNIGKLWKSNWKELTIIILTFLLLVATIILIFRK
jgi:hypothetical protein